MNREELKTLVKAQIEATKKGKKIEKKDELVNLNVRKGFYNINPHTLPGKYSQNAMEVVLHKSEVRCNDDEKSFREWNDDCLLVGLMVEKRNAPLDYVIPQLKIFKNSINAFRNRSELAKAMDTTTSGSGLEWIPTDFSSQIIDKFQLALKVAAMFGRINMPTDPFKLPAVSAFGAAKLGSENTAPTQTVAGTRNITLDAKKLIIDIAFSKELEEDAAIALLPLVRNQLGIGLARATEDATVNGDDSGTHQDSDVTAADDPRKAWKGLRKLANAAAKVDLSTFTYEAVVSLKTKMGKFGIDSSELFWIAGSIVHAKLLTLKDSNNNLIVQTINEFGPQATNVTGQILRLLGSPLIVSEFIREDLNDVGVFDGVTTNKTILVLARRDAFTYGDRRSLLVEEDVNISAQTKNMVASLRMDFKDLQDAANNNLVAIGNKIS